MNRKLARKPAACLLLMALSAAAATESLLYSQNTPLENGHWIVQKRMIEGCPQDEALVTRLPLAGNRLNLGAWNGHQEFFSRTTARPTRIRFGFRVPKGSYLDLLLGHEPGGRLSGLRLAGEGADGSFAFTSDTSGRFLAVRRLPGLVISEGRHHARLWPDQGGVAVQIDHEAPLHPQLLRMLPGSFGFRGGLAGAWVGTVEAELADGSVLLEDFRNSRRWWPLFGLHLALLTVLGALVALLPWPATPAALDRFARLSLFLALFALLWLLFDFTFWSRVPGRFFIPQNMAESDPFWERLRFAFFERWSRVTTEKRPVEEGVAASGYPAFQFGGTPAYCGPATEGCKPVSREELLALAGRARQGRRILLIGGSATAGCGASKMERTFFSLLYRHFRSRTGTATPPEIFNASSYFSVSWESFRQNSFLGDLARFSPDLVLAQRSVINDSDQEREALVAALEAAQRTTAAPVVLLLAEFDPESGWLGWKGTRETNLMLRSLAEARGIPVLDPSEAFGPESLREGSQWWDVLHLNDFGQERLAAWLAPRIGELLSRAAGGKP